MQQRYITRVLLACLFTVVWWGCNENTGVATVDPNPPTVSISLADTLVNVNRGLQFTVSASDNISLLTVGWSVTGAATFDTVVTFTETTASFSSDVTITEFTGGSFEITATATDASGNEATPDTATARVFDLQLATFVLPDPAAAIQAVRVGDSVRVQLQATNSDGLGKITFDGVAFRGSAVLGTATVVQRFETKVVDDLVRVTDTLIIRDLLATPENDIAELVTLRAMVEDARGNVDTAFVQIQLTVGPLLTVTSPADGSQVAAGFNVAVEILAQGGAISQGSAIAEVGYVTTGAVTASDKIIFPIVSRPDTTLASFVLTIPAGTPPGFLRLFPVGLDSAGNPGTGASITIEIVAVGGIDTEPPLILDSLELRVEVDDEIVVKGTDLGGIDSLGYIVTDLSGTVVSGDGRGFSGTNTNEQVTFAMRLDTVVSTFPTQLIVTTFGIDGAGNRGANSFDGTTAIAAPGQADTITVVAGITKELPTGGLVADAVVNRNLGVAGEVYLTNWQQDQLEVFDIATRSFGTPIPIGSRPWGIALWPADTLGANANMVMVANSGGTNISIVDMVGRIETRRHALPNFIIQTVESKKDPDTGLIEKEIEEFDFSDRPQFIGATCRPTDGMTTCAADSIYAVYSTTPTPGQTLPFPNLGTLRWENLTACLPDPSDCGSVPAEKPQSHFFWEHATIPPSTEADTLQVFAERGGVSETLLFAEEGITVNLPTLAFRDTTFVRNSGNFTHAFIGEGGNIGDAFARVMSYDGNVPIREVFTTLLDIDTTIVFDTTAVGPPVVVDTIITITTLATVFGPSTIDDGISAGSEVRDFISNTAISIRSIGTNFNGQTNLVRADFVYVLNSSLRLTGIVETPSGSNFGMDLNFDHNFSADARGTSVPGDSDDRLVFVATDNQEIVAYDTWNFGEVASIPIRDPIIGPLRVAKLPSGEQFLVGVTARGVVTITLPSISNSFLSPPGLWNNRDR
ncbi:MAG: hypothetical protein IID06_07830 [Gemmatimonadetes bacterium]|nr:hypothetical protein [Gemmatimonadota bacterium]